MEEQVFYKPNIFSTKKVNTVDLSEFTLASTGLLLVPNSKMTVARQTTPTQLFVIILIRTAGSTVSSLNGSSFRRKKALLEFPSNRKKNESEITNFEQTRSIRVYLTLKI